MAHPYTTEARLRAMASGRSERLLELLDRDGDGIADTDGTTSTLARAIESACNRIDAALGVRWPVPFVADPSTPGIVADCADELAAWFLYRWLDPDAKEAKAHKALADETLRELGRDGAWTIPDVEELTGDDASTGVVFESIGTYAAGGTTNGQRGVAYDSTTTDDTSGI